MTEARVPVTQADEAAADALDDALGFLTANERPLVIQALARHRLAGVAAGREEAVVPDRVRGAAAAIESTVHQINSHWWNKRVRPDARDLRIVLDFVAAAAIRQRGV